jgi:hypothetical protein
VVKKGAYAKKRRPVTPPYHLALLPSSSLTVCRVSMSQ